MDFYKELLESFSRVKGRKLHLLEGEEVDPQRKLDAETAVKNAVKGGRPALGNSTKVGNASLASTGTISAGKNHATFTKDNKLVPKGKSNFKAVLTAILGDAEGTTKKNPNARAPGRRKTKAELAAVGLKPRITKADPIPVESLVDKYPISAGGKTIVKETFKKISAMGREVYDTFLKTNTDLRGSPTFAGSAERYGNFLTGASQQSVERKLLAPKASLVLEGGTWVTQDYNLSEDQLIGVTDSYHDLMALITSDKVQCDSARTADRLKKFSTSPDGSVIIKPKVGSRGQALSFADDTGQMKHLLDLAVEKCPELEVQVEDIKAPLAGGSANDIRGVGFEKLLEIVSLATMNNGANRGKNATDLDKLIVLKITKLQDKLQKLKMTVEQWVASSKFSAIDPADLAIAQDLIKVLKVGMPKGEEGSVGGESESLFKKMIEHSREAMRVRKPILFLPVGSEVGTGQRQDILEIYKDEDAAKAAMKASGIKGVSPDCGEAGSFFKSHEDRRTLEVLDKAGKLRASDNVCTIKVSLKNYMSLNKAKYGGGRYSTFFKLMKSEVGTSQHKFLESIATNLGMKPRQKGGTPVGLQDLKDYSDEMHSLGWKVFRPEKEGGLKLTTKTTTIEGKKIKVPSGEIMATELIDALRKDHSYDELTGSSKAVRTILKKKASGKELSDKEKTTLKNLRNAGDDHDIDALVAQAEKIVDNARGSGRKSAELGFERLKYLLNDRLQAMKLRQDIHAGGSRALKAKRFIATKMFHAGGSDDNNLVCDYRDLTENKTYIFKQNDPLRDAWTSVQAGTGEWTMNITKAGQVTLSKTPGMKIELQLEVKSIKDSGGNVTGYSQTYIAEVNRGVLEHYSKNKDPKVKNPSIRSSTTLNKAMDKLHELFGVLKDKIGVMDL